jgi:hypothetical protein
MTGRTLQACAIMKYLISLFLTRNLSHSRFVKQVLFIIFRSQSKSLTINRGRHGNQDYVYIPPTKTRIEPSCWREAGRLVCVNSPRASCPRPSSSGDIRADRTVLLLTSRPSSTPRHRRNIHAVTHLTISRYTCHPSELLADHNGFHLPRPRGARTAERYTPPRGRLTPRTFSSHLRRLLPIGENSPDLATGSALLYRISNVSLVTA